MPNFSIQLAQISIGGHLEALGSPSYIYGGHHHNDSFSFVHDGDGYRFSHSSFGFGYRRCHEMDCVE